MAEVAPAGAKEVDQRPNTHDPFWDSQNDILKTYSRAPVNYCGDSRSLHARSCSSYGGNVESWHGISTPLIEGVGRLR